MKERTMYDFYPLNLARDILDGSNLARVYIPGIGAALYLLDERERQIITARYERGLTYEELAKEQGVTRERIRQIVLKALRKLKHPSYARKFIGISAAEHSAALTDIRAEQETIMAEKEKTLIAYYAVTHAPGEKPPGEVRNAMLELIEELDLSVRSYNCLRRVGKTKIADVAEMTREDLMKVRNLDRRSMEEIIAKMREKGIEIKSEEEQSNGN